ncbi:MAG: MurT ligase domain-containing protein, partial [Eggerthellaceae bacterium]|nr:MurT ligase domain-containing protein [Eggerthellaceae bacterium]
MVCLSVKKSIAQAVGSVASWGLQNIARRPGGVVPGKLALKIDPDLIVELKEKITDGIIVVVGTNGKTSVNNLVADTLIDAGHAVICNRTGANMGPGVASALMQQKPAQWGVFESDELWLAKTLPQLQADYVLLLNLFRDQLDRCGEISRIQDAIISALEASPNTTLIYNADDPQCAIIASKVKNAQVSFGVNEDMGLAQNTVSDAQMCQNCEGMVSYNYRQYGQLGDYFCESCGFKRPALDFYAKNVVFSKTGVDFIVHSMQSGKDTPIHSHQPTAYQVYNLLGAFTLVSQIGVNDKVFQKAVDDFNPKNGRLQEYTLDGRRVLLNLAKNPTGFNQNLKIITSDHEPKAVVFSINDKTADGHDISWIWDIDFEELAGHENTFVFAHGLRANDVQVRLKYAGIDAQIIEDVDDAFAALDAAGFAKDEADVYAIANYTALPTVKARLDKIAEDEKAGIQWLKPTSIPFRADDGKYNVTETTHSENPLVIMHLYPDLFNLYGDGGNVRILEKRCQWRGIPVEVRRVTYGQMPDLENADLVFIGGAPDREQQLAAIAMADYKDELEEFVEDDGTVLGICGGYQMLGRTWLCGDDLIEGLSIIGTETKRPGTKADRLIDNMVLKNDLASHPIVGYENHASRTYLDDGLEP